jgi:repressor LexA
MQALTPRQQEILQLIRDFISDTGMPPTRAEISEKLGFRSANAAEDHLRALARKGAIEMIPGSSRGIRLPEAANEGLPVVGKVAAGAPLLAIENIDTHVPIQGDFFAPPADYLLRVEGESMKDIGIMDGDLLAVQKIQTARNGEVVVARVDDEVTVKRFERKSPSQVILHAENQDFKPIEIDLRMQQFAIEGKAVGIIRR